MDKKKRANYNDIINNCAKYEKSKCPLLDKIIRTYLTDDLLDACKVNSKKRRYLKQLQSEQTKKDGDKECKTTVEPLYPVVPSLNQSHTILNEFSKQCPIVPMHRLLEKEIRKMINEPSLEKIYPHITDAILREVSLDFETITHEAGMNLKTKPPDGVTCRFQPLPYKYLGKTPNYSIYLKHRERLQEKWLLYYPLMRKILQESVTFLPNELFNLGVFHYTGIYELNDLSTTKLKDLANQAKRIIHQFHDRIINLVERDRTKVKRAHFIHYYKTCIGLQTLYVSKIISQTLEHIIDVCGNGRLVPFLKLTINFEECLVLQPAPLDAIIVYELFMIQLVQIAKEYQCVAKKGNGQLTEHYIHLDITDEYFKSTITRMSANIERLYDPVMQYIKSLDSQFCEIYEAMECKRNEADGAEMSFTVGCQTIEQYKSYLTEATSIHCDENFAIGELVLSEYIKSLELSLSAIINDMFLKLCVLHQKENADICESFEILVAKALERPTSTEELIQQGKFMIYAKTELLTKLKERIQMLIDTLIKLIEYGDVSIHHMYMNAHTIQWIEKIEEAFAQNSTMYEQLKYEAEELLHKTVREIKDRSSNLIPFLAILDRMDCIENSRAYSQKFATIMTELRNIKLRIEWVNIEETSLGFPNSTYPEYHDLTQFVYPFYHLVKVCTNLVRKTTVWLDGQFEFLIFEDCETILEDINKEILRTQKLYRNKIRQSQIEKSPLQFSGLLEDVDPMSWPSPLKLCYQAVKLIKEFRPAMTMMRIMCNDALMKRHWKDMSIVAGMDLTPNAGTTLRKMMMLGLEDDIDKYDVISSGATKERELYRTLIKMQNEWQDVLFKTSIYKDTGLLILSGLDDIQVVLDDHLLKALTMRGSVFVKPYEAEVREFYSRLVRINSTIEEWGKVQAQWLYLLPIFSSKDIVAQMPEEGTLFKEINDSFKRYMDAVAQDPRVFYTAGALGVLEAMEHNLELLEQINDGVTAYLEKKRLFFPRFFFLSNDEMLEILSETKDPLRVQPHLKKCFEAIDKLLFDEKMQIHEMISQEGEKIKFKSIVNTKEAGGSVEKWLILVEDQMITSIREQIIKSSKQYAVSPRTQWVSKWPGQVVLAVSQVHWTTMVHNALNGYEGLNMKKFFVGQQKQLQDIVTLIKDPSLTNLARITIKALIVIDVHAKDVVQDLYEKNVADDREFKWLSQLRYYLEEDECLVRLVNATVKYAYEYLGNSDRLVITPLTDRCYRTLVGAYHLHLNGAPEGPAGTGKTETTKDLAKALAVQCVVFNCSDGLDYKAMGKFFKGLASCGAWACFDEFNRIDIEVLSVVAQQILSIVQAVRANVTTFMFEGTELILNPACYVCITMNPGYAGRSELPDNLKVLFRTVAMMVPDYAMIGEISLYSFGFTDARNLSVKIVTVYRLCSEQLSSQNHYDYGMRAVKSVLLAAGNNKRAYPKEDEEVLLLRAIMDVNLPKFLSHDLGLFAGIISDLFPGIALPAVDYDLFNNAMTTCARKNNLQAVDTFLIKIIQTYEMMIVRHGFMIVGGPFAGKSSTLKTLAEGLTLLNSQGLPQEKVQYEFLNPKSITMGQLYGCFDPISYEWFDGVVANTFRDFVTDPCKDRKWLIFDGPVDAVWIENMNTTLDDNKKLCLMSGEVMSMTNSMSLIFEVMDLEQASPATVSRCGMIYMEPSSLGWKPLFHSWIPHQNPEWCEGRADFIEDMFDWLVPPCLQFITKKCVQYCNSGEINLVKNTMNLIQMYLDKACGRSVKKEEDFKFLRLWIEATFIMSIVWGLAGVLDTDSRLKFDHFFKEILANENKSYPVPENIEALEVMVPHEGILADYSFFYKTKGAWKYWPEIVKYQRVDETLNIQQAIIPTVDTARYVSILRMYINNKQPFLVVGPTGTGKSFYIQDLLLNKIDKELYEPAFITFTVQISANQTQELIISKLFKRRRGIYGPPRGKTAVLFIDDVNMPQKEVYGAQPPIELLRQFFDHKNWFDLKAMTKLYMQDIMFTAAMGLVGGSRQEIYARFLRHFGIISINEFSTESMAKIFTNVLHLGWKNNGFPSDIISMVNPTVAASQEIYRSATEELRPTPSKSHYVFNLRDFSRLIQGCAMLRKDSITEEVGKKIFPRIFTHEVLRIFYDRLIEPQDKAWLFNKLKNVVKDFFREPFEQLFQNLPRSTSGEITEDSMKALIFGTYFDQDAVEEERKYEEVTSLQVFGDMCRLCLDDYNSSHKNKMDIILFDYALEHLSRICRILAMPSGSGLLVGISGSGRQSLTRLASEIYAMKLYQPEITKNYGLNEWRDDIKIALKESGGFGKSCTFLIAEGQIKQEVFLQDVDCLLNSGEVPNIYPIDEKQEILEMVRLAAQGGNRNLDITAVMVFLFFTKRCREKLHIILCFSPVGNSFRNRLRLFPALINCCTIDWFEEWPESALEDVANNWMGDVNLEQDVKDNAVIACKYFHIEARNAANDFLTSLGRKIYVTSASQLELIKSFTILTNTKQQEITKARRRYLGGLEKLQHAASSIAVMQKSLAELQPQLQAMSIQAKQMTAKIEHETLTVEKASALVKKDERIANKQAAAANLLKSECEADLADVIPILNEALTALDTLKPADITLVKSMKNPPSIVKTVLAAVCIMKDIKPNRVADPATGRMLLDYWGPSKRMLGDMNFLQGLKDYDKDNIRADIILKIRKEYLPQKEFQPSLVAKASSAAEGLCKWIIAMDMYEKAIKVVAPKKAKLAAAEKELSDTMKFLTEKRAEVERLEAALALLNEKFEEAMLKQTELLENVKLCNDKLLRAQKLIGGLGGEKNRWTEAANLLLEKFDGIAGDILISCGVLTYLPAFNAQFRQKIVSSWHGFIRKLKIPCAETYDLVTVLGVDVLIQTWNIYGLPRDNFSVENGIIMANSRRWSLFIDPQGQASSWIRKLEKRNDLEVVKFSYADYMKKIEMSIQVGQPVLIDSVEETLEAPLDPVLFKKVFRQAGMDVIALGDNVIQYNKNFKLYMCSKLRNPHYLPEIFNKVTIINFALTLDGLQDQLLGIVVATEKPELQQLKEELIVQKAENKAALLHVEENILRTLSESKGDILEDEKAIEVLDTSKILSTEIREKQEQSLIIEKSIEEFRVKYQGVAEHSAVLYYCISDLANVDPMYQYSLEWFINLYIGSILKAEKFRIIEKRCLSLINGFTFDLYSNITRSLFEKDKLLFSFLLCAKIMLYQKKLSDLDFMFLLTGGVSVENTIPNPCPWLPANSWNEICRTSDIKALKGFREDFSNHHEKWKFIYDDYEPQNKTLPSPWNETLNPFIKIIIIRLLRPDKLIVAISNYVQGEMGQKFVTPPQFNIALSYTESYSLCPLIFILSAGTDPMASLVKFAVDKKFSDKFQSISLGQGQGPIAQALIEEAQLEGCWVCLQNCHLATSWMPTLEKIFDGLDYTNTHDSFRLWLTSYPSDKFPVTLLQRGVKMTNEPPTGLQQNLLKSYTSNPVKDEEFFEGCPGKEEMFTRLLYGVAFFHAVVQERRTFGALGWNIPYGFNDSDFDISVQQVRMFINESDEPYEALAYLIGECNYGGRVTDDWDRRLIVTILADFLNEDVATDSNYKFVNIAECYGLPQQTDYEDYVNYIKNMPQVHPPEAFGLHNNAGITRDLQNSQLLLNAVMKAYGEGQGGGSVDVDKYITMMTTDILGKVPKMYDLDVAKAKFPIIYEESMNTVLVQEMERFNKLTRVIRTSLVNMQRAIQGLVAMSPSLEAFSSALMLGRIPAEWMKVSYPSLKNLSNYITDFVRRIDFLQNWCDNGKPSSFWVSGFFFTQAFLTGVKQNYSRKFKIPIDKLTFDFDILQEDIPKKSPTDGAYIYGLFTDGGRWNRQTKCIDELLPKILNDVMPSIWVKPILLEKLNIRGRYNCPVYKVSTRRGTLSTTGHSTNYVVPILLETKVGSAFWIKRSVALLCQLD